LRLRICEAAAVCVDAEEETNSLENSRIPGSQKKSSAMIAIPIFGM
jgi:hypothetical protein